MSDLPKEWIQIPLQEVVQLNPKSALDDELIVGFSPMAMIPTDFRGVVEFEEKPWAKVKKGYTHFQDEDVLFAKVTPCFENGKAAYVTGLPNGKGAGSTEYFVLRPFAHCLDSKYLLALVKTRDFLRDGALNMTGSVGLKRVPKEFVQNYPFPLAPLAEQREIADRLDTLLAQVDTLKGRLDALPAILKRFRQSVLAAAVSGKLTEEWRSDNPDVPSGLSVKDKWLKARRAMFEQEQERLIKSGKQKRAKKFKDPLFPDLEKGRVEFPLSWDTVSVSQFAECLDNLRVPVTKADRNSAKGLFPYFGANGEVDRVDEFIFDDDLVLVTEDETFYGRTKPIAYRFTGKCWVNNHAHVLRAPTKEANDFLCYALMYYNVIPWLSGTTGRAKLTQAALNSLPLGLPPEEEQTEIVRRVEQLFTFADQIEQRVKDAQSRVNHLTQSILAKAFRGELTADWREQHPELISGENSAEALLACIQTERAAQTPAKRTRKQKASA